jgi:MFS family permease
MQCPISRKYQDLFAAQTFFSSPIVLIYKELLFTAMKSSIFTRNLTLVISSFAMSLFAWSVITPIMPLYITSIGVKPEIMGIMIALSWAGQIIGEIAGGWLADIRGIKLPVLIGTIGSAPLITGLIFAQDTILLMSIFFAWGLVRSTIFGPTRGFIGSHATASNKVTLMALYNIGIGFSSSLGSFISGFIADNLGFSWNFSITAGIFTIAGVIICFFNSKKIDLKPEDIPDIPRTRDENGRSLTNRIFIIQCLIGALFFMGMGIEMTFLPLLLTQNIGVKATEVGILITIGLLISTILLVPISRLADAKGVKWFIISGLLIYAVSFFGFAFPVNYLWLIVIFSFFCIGRTVFEPAAAALLSNTIPLRRQSTAMGLYGGCEDVGLLFGSLIGGYTWGIENGTQLTFIVGGIALILAAALGIIMLTTNSQLAALHSFK